MPLRDKDGEIIGTFGISKNITERKQAEEVLRKNEEKLKELFEKAPVGYHEIDELGNITAVNQTELKMLGFTTSEEMIGFPVWEFVADNEESRKRTLGKLAGNLPPDINSERFIVRRDGTSFPALIDDAILRNEQGKITGIRTTLLDITDRKHVEEALAKERNLLRTLIDALPDRIYAKDIQARFTLNNISHLKALGVKSQEEALGKTDYDFRAKEFADRYFAGDKQVLQTGKPIIGLEDQVVLASGEKGWVLSTKIPLYDTQGNIIGLVGNSSDITERKRSEEALRETVTTLKTCSVLQIFLLLSGILILKSPGSIWQLRS